jgi:hypothetical protein
VDSEENAWLSMCGAELIVRQNLACENRGGNGLHVRGSPKAIGVSEAVRNLRVYNNTAINSETPYRQRESGSLAALTGWYGFKWVNNYVESDANVNYVDNNTGFLLQDADTIPLQGYANSWLGHEFRNNWVSTLAIRGGPGPDKRVRMISNGAGLLQEDDILDAATTWPNNFIRNAETTMTFVGYTDENDCNFTDLAIASGDGIGDAEHLTTVTASSTGNTIAVADAYFFYDGFDLDYWGEWSEADIIMIYDSTGHTGSSRCNIRLHDVVDQNTIQLEASCAVQTGDTVYRMDALTSDVMGNIGASQ